MRVRWSPDALSSARRYMDDQAGMQAINAAVGALAADPEPPEGFHRGSYHRIRVGPYRIRYFIDDDVISVEHVGRVLG